jgi:predicted nucleotide-binding protein (sugar kinase/HSP70/actin superfamily)
MSELKQDFLKENPYPTYDEMTEKWLERRIDLDAEYGLKTHNLCRKVYVNLDKPNILEKVVEELISTVLGLGGKQALRANLETLINYTPLQFCKDQQIIDALHFVTERVYEALHNEKRM